MSGAEALAGVSLVCNVIQIVTFARDVIITYKSIEDNHSPDPRLAQMCEVAREPYEQLLKDTQHHVGPMGEEEQALVQGAQKCIERIEELRRMVSRLSVPANSSRPRKTMKIIGRGVSSLWRKSQVAALERDLERYQALVDTHLLRHISGNVRSSEAQNLRSFAELDDRFKQLLSSYKTDNATIQGFISEQYEKTQAYVKQTGAYITTHVDRQLAATEQVIRSDLTALETNRMDEKTRTEQEEQRKRVLESFYFPERNSRWNRIEENYPETFGWVLSIPGESQRESDTESDTESDIESDTDSDTQSDTESDMESDTESEDPTSSTFAPWLRSDSKLFWISGKPASGKSTLMKYIITNPETLEHLKHWQPNVHIIHHFFWKPGASMENSVDGMLCSLIYQILESQPSLVESISRPGLDLAAKRSPHDWSTKELKAMILNLPKESDVSFCIFLDGLDEAVEKLHKFDIKSLLDGLTQLDRVKVCASGRPEPKFAKYFTATEQISIHNLTRRDIKRLVYSRLKSMQLDPDFRLALASIVVTRAKGVFIWVILVLNSVEMNIERETPEECLKRVSRMAQDLHSLYRDMWTRAKYHGIDRATAALYFNLIVKRHHPCFTGFIGSQDHYLPPSTFQKTNIFDLAIMEDEGFLTTFFQDYDSVTAAELSDMVERTKKRVELGSAGLLECVADTCIKCSNDAALQEAGVYASHVVDFTHRTVFDFFTDSEYGRNILLECSLADTEFVTRSLKSLTLHFRYLHPRGSSGVVFDRLCVETGPTSGFGEIIRLAGRCEAYHLDMLDNAREIVGILWEWYQKGCFDSLESANWEEWYRRRFGLPKDRATVRFVEFVDALTNFYPRMAIEYIPKLGALDLSNALPVVLRAGNDTRDHSEWFNVVRHTLSRISELRHAGKYTALEDLGQDISLALSFFLRKLFFILHHYGSHLEKQTHVQGILKNAAEIIGCFTKLDISGHCWSRRYAISLNWNLDDNSMYWQLGTCATEQFVFVSCNDLFLKKFLATKDGLRCLEELGQREACEPVFEVLLFQNGRRNNFQPWGRPSASWARRMEFLLSQTLTGRQSFLSLKYQYVDLFREFEDRMSFSEPDEYIKWKVEILARLGSVQHPWIPIQLD